MQGTLYNRIGTGGGSGVGVGTVGRAGGKGVAYGRGVGKKVQRNMISLSVPVITGTLSKDAIQKVIKSHRNQIRYCYEKELQRNPKLEGRVVVTFIIAATGRVAKVVIRSTTLNNTRVEACLRKKIKTWIFPAPAGGGIVEVNYPFVFRAK